jgi:hypothetical protein
MDVCDDFIGHRLKLSNRRRVSRCTGRRKRKKMRLHCWTDERVAKKSRIEDIWLGANHCQAKPRATHP